MQGVKLKGARTSNRAKYTFANDATSANKAIKGGKEEEEEGKTRRQIMTPQVNGT